MRNGLLMMSAVVILGGGGAIVAQQQPNWYPAPVAPGVTPPPPSRSDVQPPTPYPAPQQPGTQPPAQKHSVPPRVVPQLTTGQSSSGVPLILGAEDAARPSIHGARGMKNVPLVQGRSWKIATKNLGQNTTGRELVLTRANTTPMTLRIEQWNESDVIARLADGSLAEGAKPGSYRLEVREAGQAIAARTLQVLPALVDDFDEDGFGAEADCDDLDSRRYPQNSETCDRLDNNCDGAIDEGVSLSVFADADRDGFGTGEALLACEVGQGFASRAGDCNDRDPAVKPGAGCPAAK